jgi:hypothetical protein
MGLGKALGKPATQRSYEEAAVFPLPKSLIGVEVEVENHRNTDSDVFRFWTAKADGSLRGLSCEYVLTEPLFGKDLLSAISVLCKSAANHKWAINYRTSIHVHLDVRDIDFPVFKNLCAVYALSERLLYDWVGFKRDQSIFCLPWQDADVDMEKIRAIFTATEKDAEARATVIHRYSGLNLNALARFGSVEFRHMRTTYEYQTILEWICIIQSLKAYAQKVGENHFEIIERYDKIGPEAYFGEVFGYFAESLFLKRKHDLKENKGRLLALDLLRPDILKSMGILFKPTNNFLTPCTKNEWFAKWEKENKKVTTVGFPDNLENWFPPAFSHHIVGCGLFIDRPPDTYAHPYVPRVGNPGSFRAVDFNSNDWVIIGNETVNATLSMGRGRPGNRAESEVLYQTVNRRLHDSWVAFTEAKPDAVCMYYASNDADYFPMTAWN